MLKGAFETRLGLAGWLLLVPLDRFRYTGETCSCMARSTFLSTLAACLIAPFRRLKPSPAPTAGCCSAGYRDVCAYVGLRASARVRACSDDALEAERGPWAAWREKLTGARPVGAAPTVSTPNTPVSQCSAVRRRAETLYVRAWVLHRESTSKSFARQKGTFGALPMRYCTLRPAYALHMHARVADAAPIVQDREPDGLARFGTQANQQCP